MLEKELLMRELWRRLTAVSGVQFTARNPKQEPKPADCPLIQFFELEDNVVSHDNRGSIPIYKRRAVVVVEPFIKGSTEEASSKELGEFVTEVKKEIYRGGPTLGRKGCSVTEIEASRILRPAVGENVAGISLSFEIVYIENINNLY